MSVSVFIQTLNEEKNLPRCLDSTSWSDDIVVLDSYSSDGTVQLARAAGARVFQREYDGRANNQNWAVENIEFKYPWVWYVDADEVTPPELAKEIQETCADQSRPEVAYYVRRRNYFMGRWLKHGMYNVWIPRLWRPAKIRWERSANPVSIIDGPVGQLRHDLIHYLLSKGFKEFFERHNRTSSYEAEDNIKALQQSISWKNLLLGDHVARRNELKHLSVRMPGRALLRFAYMYLLRGGILDGRAGLSYSVIMSIYEYMICIKIKELRRRQKGLPV